MKLDRQILTLFRLACPPESLAKLKRLRQEPQPGRSVQTTPGRFSQGWSNGASSCPAVSADRSRRDSSAMRVGRKDDFNGEGLLGITRRRHIMALETHYRQLLLTNACYGMRWQQDEHIAASPISLLYGFAGQSLVLTKRPAYTRESN